MATRIIGRLPFKKQHLVPVVAVFATLGAILLIRSFAATGDISLEAENGQISGPATVMQDSAASNSAFLRFGGTTPPPPSTGTPAKRFVLHQQGPPKVGYLANNVAAYDALPFDGTSFIFDESHLIMRDTPVSESSIRNQLSALNGKNFQRAKHNMALVYASPAGPFDTSFDVVAQNFGKLAAAIRDTQNIDMIKFDIEEYFGEPAGAYMNDGWGLWHQTNYTRICWNGQSDDYCRQTGYAAGKKVMQAIINNWPNAKIMTTFGPWVSSPEAANFLDDHFPTSDLSYANKFQGNFMAGMLDATVGTNARWIDGGEMYYFKAENGPFAVKDYMKNTFPDQAPYIVPAALRPQWPNYYRMSFGTYDWPGETPGWVGRTTHNADLVRRDNLLALGGTDEYVWYYSEQHNFAGNPQSGGKPSPPGDWMQALWDAYNSIPHP